MSREKGTNLCWMTKLKIENFSFSPKCTISFSPFSSHHHLQSSAFLYLSTSSFTAAAKASPFSSLLSLSLFFSHTPLQPNRLATMPPAKRDQNTNTNVSNPELTATIRASLSMTTKQIDLIFELTHRKFEAEMSAAEVEARLKRELIVKRSKARVAASVAAASSSTTAAASSRRPITDEEDDITGDVPTEVMSITPWFAGLL